MHHYLTKHTFHKEPLIKESPDPDLSIIVVIPAYKEESLITVLEDLLHCDATSSGVEVIVIINHAETADQNAKDININAYREGKEWTRLNDTPKRRFRLVYQPDLPAKKAGVGLARKIGMDEAARRLDAINRPHGVILCLDADCRVERNYLREVGNFFEANPKIEGCSIKFQHRIEGLSEAHKRAITDYEAHLRYFIGMQRWAGCPYAFQTIGSAMAVRADVYCKVGGMNTRQAGEDFYFLQKVIQRGAFSELNTTTVYPSSRISDRVPFGTGRAMITALESGTPLTSYNPQSFIDLKAFIEVVPELYAFKGDLNVLLSGRTISPCVIQFLQVNQFELKLAELQSNTSSQQAFVKRFFHWFDAFVLMKYVHFAGDNIYQNIPVPDACSSLVNLRNTPLFSGQTTEHILDQMRTLDLKEG